MDQGIVVGVGNIYAAEALFAAGISPLREAGKVSRERYHALADAVKRILAYAIERGGTTLRDFISPDGLPGYFELELSAYGRGGEPCPRCGKAMKQASIGQRDHGLVPPLPALKPSATNDLPTQASPNAGIFRRLRGKMSETADITELLDAARDGDRGALDRVLATLYQELHSMARRQLAGQHGHTLDATALVHEAYLKLVGRNSAQFDDRAHFFAYAASAMRSVVVDYARQRLAQKRGGDLHRVTELPEEVEGGLRLDEETLGLDTALTRLAAVDARLAQVVELRYFAGLSELEIAALLKRSERSIRRDWQKARLFLLASLKDS